VVCEAEDHKRLTYVSLSVTYCFVPVAVETVGALEADATDYMHIILVVGFHFLHARVRRLSFYYNAPV